MIMEIFKGKLICGDNQLKITISFLCILSFISTHTHLENFLVNFIDIRIRGVCMLAGSEMISERRKFFFYVLYVCLPVLTVEVVKVK